MKNLKKTLVALATVISLVSCSTESSETPNNTAPTAQAFANLQQTALASITQNFTLTAESGITTLTSAKGVTIKIDGAGLRKNGNPVTGTVTVEYAEVFDGGKMLTADKTTMGLNGNGQMEAMKSGGEYYIQARQGGVDLTTVTPVQVKIPATLTGTTPDTGMQLWTGQAPTTGANMLAWIPTPGAAGGIDFGGPQGSSNSYNVGFTGFGWTNVDRFAGNTGPKTLLLATVPAGYNDSNCAIYLHYDGLGTQLAKFDRYLTATQQFSEHYGQIPVGLACHAIFVTEDNGQWRYAIKAFTVQMGDIYNFTLAETSLGNQAQLEAAINALP
ncbi:MAG: hypothetical protein H7239_09340 [Flavobacterium sp.]|nr:hypothetical protein [Flavobacterium sp.]